MAWYHFLFIGIGVVLLGAAIFMKKSG